MSDPEPAATTHTTPSSLRNLWEEPAHRRWLGWASLSALFLLVGLHRSSMAVLATELQRSFDTTGAGLGLLHSSFFYLYAALQLPAGVVTDLAGSRRAAVYGGLLMSLGAVVFGASPTYLVAFGGRALIGLGASVIFLATLRFCANWFRATEFATMTGVTMGASALGGMLATTPLAVAVERVGWRSSVLALGGLGLLGVLAVTLTVRNTPEDAGLPPMEGVPPAPSQSAPDLRSNLTQILRSPVTWLIGLLFFCGIGVTLTIYGLWGIPYLVQLYDLSVTRASAYILVAGVGWLFGPVVFGHLSDRLETRTPILLGSVVVVTGVWTTLAVVGTPGLLLVGALLFVGRFLGSGATLAFTVVKEHFPTDASGTAMGAVNSIGWFGAAVFPVLLGAVLDAFWTGEVVNGARVYTETGYRAGFAIAAAASLVMVICAVLVHRRARGID